LTGQVIVPQPLVNYYTQIFIKAYEYAVENKRPDPMRYAEDTATAAMANVPQGIMAGRPGVNQPMPQVGAQPGDQALRTPQLGAQPGEPTSNMPMVDMAPLGATDPGTGQKITRDASGWIAKLQQEEKQAAALGDYARATEISQARKALEGQQQPQAQRPGKTPYPETTYRDKAVAGMREATADVTGKKLGEEYADLQNAASASATLKAQLGTLKELYTIPNIPEGALGEKLQGIRSSLASLGIEVGPEVGAGDMVAAIGGKLALLTRTAEGGNLMPGAMSDFEQKILRSLSPGLNQTAAGRAALTDFLIDMADVRMRLASEANKLAKDGILPPEWYTRRDRVLKEEQARLALRAREMAAKFKGTK
jgi:hypothetical protein